MDNEQAIVERCRQGDRHAQRELYALTGDRVYHLLLRMTRNADDAFDLAQDTYVRVFERIHQFDGASSVGTWVYRVAVNEGLQFLRRRRRYDRVLLEQGRDGAAEGEGQSGSENGEADLRLDVQGALGGLPDAERELLVLKYFAGLDYAEMAEILRKPAGTIASGLNRARQMLRERLGEDAGPAA